MLNRIKEFINGCLQTCHATVTAIIYTNGLKRLKNKELKEQKRYEKLCESFDILIDPFTVPERYIVIRGQMFRIVFKPEGVSVTDSNGDFVTDRLIRLKLLQRLSKESK